MQQRHHKSCREKLEEATFDILYEMQDENTMLTYLKKIQQGFGNHQMPTLLTFHYSTVV